MGQGTDSCGGYDVEYDPYSDEPDGMWTTRTGTSIHVSKMALSHLKGARHVAQMAARRATFTDEREKWEGWVEAFDDEIADRERQAARTVVASPTAPQRVLRPAAKPPQKVRGKTVTMICHCGQEYEAREADLKRGWALSHDKRCAAIRRDFGRPAAKRKR